ncbi:MAG: hypothetical protein U1B79_01940 [Candidatus Pacearchaeota archaeon]|nr:hypothetical protein [Nanoarchaeota archaeon]MDZ4226844.1 hypothetical protein [Candidatus Pacearchaeota archaeon]
MKYKKPPTIRRIPEITVIQESTSETIEGSVIRFIPELIRYKPKTRNKKNRKKDFLLGCPGY